MPKSKKLNTDIHAFLKNARIQAGLSQGKVAKALGYGSPQFVSNWERGIAEPPVNTFKSLAKLYKIEMEEMFSIVLDHTVNKVTSELKLKFHAK